MALSMLSDMPNRFAWKNFQTIVQNLKWVLERVFTAAFTSGALSLQFPPALFQPMHHILH